MERATQRAADWFSSFVPLKNLSSQSEAPMQEPNKKKRADCDPRVLTYHETQRRIGDNRKNKKERKKTKRLLRQFHECCVRRSKVMKGDDGCQEVKGQ